MVYGLFIQDFMNRKIERKIIFHIPSKSLRHRNPKTSQKNPHYKLCYCVQDAEPNNVTYYVNDDWVETEIDWYENHLKL